MLKEQTRTVTNGMAALVLLLVFSLLLIAMFIAGIRAADLEASNAAVYILFLTVVMALKFRGGSWKKISL